MVYCFALAFGFDVICLFVAWNLVFKIVVWALVFSVNLFWIIDDFVGFTCRFG